MNRCDDVLNNPERLKALHSTGLFDAPSEEALERLNQLATKVLKAPISVFTLLSNIEQVYKSSFGLPPEIANARFPIKDTICQYALDNEYLAIEDTKNHPDFLENGPIQNFQLGGYLGIPVKTKEGHILGTVCVFDFATRKWTQDEIDSLKIITHSFVTEIELRTSLKKANEFMAIASHEMKSPLTVIKMHAQIAERKSLDALTNPKKFFEVLNQQVNRLTVLIEDIFDVSRLSSGKLSMKMGRHCLGQILDNSLANFTNQLSDAGCELSHEPFSGHFVNCDGYRVEQVISNLVSNAIKYAPGNPIKVITLVKDNKIHISIKDSGPGLSEESMARVFDPFQRFNSDTSVKGLGIGLYLSKQIMNDNGGDLVVESSLGQGSSFTFTLPIA